MTGESGKRPRVIFSPSGRRGTVAPGTSVLDAARQLGVDLDSVCGGRGVCGRCQVSVIDGKLAKEGIASAPLNLAPPGVTETTYAREHGLEHGYRLGCCARITGDVAIDVPSSSQVHQQVVRKPGEIVDIETDPVVRPCLVDIPAPTRGSVVDNVQSLVDVLDREWGIEKAVISEYARQRLPPALRSGSQRLTAIVRRDNTVIDVRPGLCDTLYGVAVDVGSTTLAAHLCDLHSGELRGSTGTMNPQIRFGEDLISRVSWVMSHPGAENELTQVVREAINGLIDELAAGAGIDCDDIVEIVLVGNSIMHHLLLGISPVGLGRAPFALATSDSTDIRATEIGIDINPGGHAYVLPCIAGHVGADAAGVMLAEAPFDRDDVSLVVDIGTNAEIFLGGRDRLLAASSPTGPAFEGAQISCGQRAAPGAIERVRIDRATRRPTIKVIGSGYWSDDARFEESLPAGGVTGICGSGIIEAIAEMYATGIIGADGRVHTDDHTFLLYEGARDVRIDQGDVRAIQLAKAALYAGVQLLMNDLGVTTVDRIRLAGAFGAQIDPRYAMTLGLIPDCDLSAVSAAGNAAGTGARIALLNNASRQRIESEVRSVDKIETATRPEFQDLYVKAMTIPHAVHDFPKLRAATELPAPTPSRRRSTPSAPANRQGS